MIEAKNITNEISALSLHLDNNAGDMNKSDPSEQFISDEIKRLNKRRQIINDSFLAWIPSKYFEKEKDKLKYYEKENDVPKLKIQIKALIFILDK